VLFIGTQFSNLYTTVDAQRICLSFQPGNVNASRHAAADASHHCAHSTFGSPERGNGGEQEGALAGWAN
jgi:hypothetical protein